MRAEATLTPIPSPPDQEVAGVKRVAIAPLAGSNLPTLIDGLSMNAVTFMGIEFDWPLVQLIDGEVLMSPTPSYNHQRCSASLSLLLLAHTRSRKLGEVVTAPCDWVVDDETVLQPDLIWYPTGHPKIKNRSNLERTPPALVVEILSPSTSKFDMGKKRAIYQAAGVAHYWLVDPTKKTIEGLELRNGVYQPCSQTKDGAFLSAPFADLAITLSEVFDWE